MKPLILILNFLIFFAITSMFTSVSAHADDVVKLLCQYDTYSDQEGNHKSNGFTLLFNINSKTKESSMIGNLGKVDGIFVPNSAGFGFLEKSADGNLFITTIKLTGESVHSRNTIMLGKLIPSQYYGTCSVQ